MNTQLPKDWKWVKLGEVCEIKKWERQTQLAEDIVENLEAGLESFKMIIASLNKK